MRTFNKNGGPKMLFLVWIFWIAVLFVIMFIISSFFNILFNTKDETSWKMSFAVCAVLSIIIATIGTFSNY